MASEQAGSISRRGMLAGAAAVGALGVLTAAGCSNGSSNKGAVDKEIIVTSFGTTFDNSRHITIGAIEDIIRESHPDWKVQRAFTAQDIIDKLAQGKGINADGSDDNYPITIMNFEEALKDASDKGIKTLVVLPTHLTAGAEYQDVKNALGQSAKSFTKTAMVGCLLNEDSDYRTVLSAVRANTKEYDDGSTAFVLLGHGNEKMGGESDKFYDQTQSTIDAMEAEDPAWANYFVCTVEGTVQKEDAYKLMQASGKNYKRVVLEDFMVVCGDHANNDMAGDEDSLKTYFAGLGYTVIPILDGLGQMLPVQELYRKHLDDTLKKEKLN
jgi:sirohydrochlorin cobaltochelatase